MAQEDIKKLEKAFYDAYKVYNAAQDAYIKAHNKTYKIRKAYADAESAFNKAYKAYTDALKEKRLI